MDNSMESVAQRLARAAIAFERQRTGHGPSAVTVMVSEETLVITLQGALSTAEKAMAQTPEGAARLQEYHRQLFAESCEPLRREIKRITGAGVREARAEVETTAGTMAGVFTTGTVVQVFLLDDRVATDAWKETRPDDGASAQ